MVYPWFCKGQKFKKEIEEFEKSIKNCDECLYGWYQEVVAYWKEWAKQNNEKNKKDDGSKRVRVPKTETTKKPGE